MLGSWSRRPWSLWDVSSICLIDEQPNWIDLDLAQWVKAVVPGDWELSGVANDWTFTPHLAAGR